MTEKHIKQFSIKLTESQHTALSVEAEMRAMSDCDLVRSILDDLGRKHKHTYRLLAETYKEQVNNEN